MRLSQIANNFLMAQSLNEFQDESEEKEFQKYRMQHEDSLLKEFNSNCNPPKMIQSNRIIPVDNQDQWHQMINQLTRSNYQKEQKISMLMKSIDSKNEKDENDGSDRLCSSNIPSISTFLNKSRMSKYQQYESHQSYISSHSATINLKSQQIVSKLKEQEEKIEILIEKEQAITQECINSLKYLQFTIQKNKAENQQLEDQNTLIEKKQQDIQFIPTPILYNQKSVQLEVNKSKKLQKDIALIKKNKIDELKSFKEQEKISIASQKEEILKLRYQILQRSQFNEHLLLQIENEHAKEREMFDREKQRVSICHQLSCLQELHCIFFKSNVSPSHPAPLLKKKRRNSRSACFVPDSKQIFQLTSENENKCKTDFNIGKKDGQKQRIYRSASVNIFHIEEEKVEEQFIVPLESLKEEDFGNEEINAFRNINMQLKHQISSFYNLVGENINDFTNNLIKNFNLAVIENASLNSSYEIRTNEAHKKKRQLEDILKEVDMMKQESKQRQIAFKQMSQFLDVESQSIDSGVIILKQEQNEIDQDHLNVEQKQANNKVKLLNPEMSTVNMQQFAEFPCKDLRVLKENSKTNEKFAFWLYLFLNEFSYRVCTLVKLLTTNSGLVPFQVQLRMRDLSQVLGKKHFKLFIPAYYAETDDIFKPKEEDGRSSKELQYRKIKNSRMNNQNDSIEEVNQKALDLIPIKSPQIPILLCTPRIQNRKKSIFNSSERRNSFKEQTPKNTLGFPLNSLNVSSHNISQEHNSSSLEISLKVRGSEKGLRQSIVDENKQAFQKRSNTRHKTSGYEHIRRSNNSLNVTMNDLKYEQEMPSWNKVVQMQKLKELAMEIIPSECISNFCEGLNYLYKELKADRFLGYFLSEDKIQEYFIFLAQEIKQEQEQNQQIQKLIHETNPPQNTYDENEKEGEDDENEENKSSQDSLINEESSLKENRSKGEIQLDIKKLKQLELTEIIRKNLGMLKYMAQKECNCHLQQVTSTLRDLIGSIRADSIKKKTYEVSNFLKDSLRKKTRSLEKSKKERKEHQIFLNISQNNKFIEKEYKKASEKAKNYFNSDDQVETLNFKPSFNFGNNSSSLEKQIKTNGYSEFLEKASQIHNSSKNKLNGTQQIRTLLRQFYSPPQQLGKIYFIQKALMPFLRQQMNKLFSEESQIDTLRTKIKKEMKIEKEEFKESQISGQHDKEKKSALESIIYQNKNRQNKEISELQKSTLDLYKVSNLDKSHPPLQQSYKGEPKNAETTKNNLLKYIRQNNTKLDNDSNMSEQQNSSDTSEASQQSLGCSGNVEAAETDKKSSRVIQLSSTSSADMNQKKLNPIDNKTNLLSQLNHRYSRNINSKLLKPLQLHSKSNISLGSFFDISKRGQSPITPSNAWNLNDNIIAKNEANQESTVMKSNSYCQKHSQRMETNLSAHSINFRKDIFFENSSQKEQQQFANKSQLSRVSPKITSSSSFISPSPYSDYTKFQIRPKLNFKNTPK